MTTKIYPAIHSEAAFESIIEESLLRNGYYNILSPYSIERAFFPDEIIAFIQTTQPNEWAKLEALHGEKTKEQVLTDLCKWMDSYGSLHTLRHV
jgi:type I restriction enzyme R subunit